MSEQRRLSLEHLLGVDPTNENMREVCDRIRDLTGMSCFVVRRGGHMTVLTQAQMNVLRLPSEYEVVYCSP